MSHIKGHYRSVNGKTVYVSDYENKVQRKEHPEAPAAQLHERTGVGKHKDGSWFLRATDSEDRGHIQAAADKHKVKTTWRRASANHHGRPGVYDHAHVGSSEDAAKVLHELKGKAKAAEDATKAETATHEDYTAAAEAHDAVTEHARTMGANPDADHHQAQGQKYRAFSKIKEDTERVFTNFKAAMEAYAKHPASKDGRHLDVDEMRELVAPYRNNRTDAAAIVHEDISRFNKQLYAHRMAMPVESAGEKVTFLAGGGGSGKGTASKAYGFGNSSHTIVDGVLGNFEKADKMIQQALASGRHAEIVFIHAPIEKAVGQMVGRAVRNDYGRIVSLKAMAEGHAGAQETMRRLIEKYGGDGSNGVHLHIVDNSAGKMEESKVISEAGQMLEALKGWKYGEDLPQRVEKAYNEAKATHLENHAKELRGAAEPPSPGEAYGPEGQPKHQARIHHILGALDSTLEDLRAHHARNAGGKGSVPAGTVPERGEVAGGDPGSGSAGQEGAGTGGPRKRKLRKSFDAGELRKLLGQLGARAIELHQAGASIRRALDPVDKLPEAGPFRQACKAYALYGGTEEAGMKAIQAATAGHHRTAPMMKALLGEVMRETSSAANLDPGLKDETLAGEGREVQKALVHAHMMHLHNGGVTQVREHETSRKASWRDIFQPNRAEKKFQAARDARKAAARASHEAHTTQHPDHHQEAAGLHEKAAKAFRKIGGAFEEQQEEEAKHHDDMAALHRSRAGREVKKSHVKGHNRTLASGQVVQVKEHDDRRRAAEEKSEALRREIQEHTHKHGASDGSTYGTWKFNPAFDYSATAARTMRDAHHLDDGGVVGHTRHEAAYELNKDAALNHRWVAKEIREKHPDLAAHAALHDDWAARHGELMDYHAYHFGRPEAAGVEDPVEEHERLVKVLESPSHEDDKVEAKAQAEELAELKGQAGTAHVRALAAAKAVTGPAASEMLGYSKVAHAASEAANRTGDPNDHFIANALHMAASASHDQAREDSDYADNGHEAAWLAHLEAERHHAGQAGDATVSPKDLIAAHHRLQEEVRAKEIEAEDKARHEAARPGPTEMAHPRVTEALEHAQEAKSRANNEHHDYHATQALKRTREAAEASHAAHTKAGSAAGEHERAFDLASSAENMHYIAGQHAPLQRTKDSHTAAARALHQAAHHHWMNYREHQAGHQVTLDEAIAEADSRGGMSPAEAEAEVNSASATAHRHSKSLDIGGTVVQSPDTHAAARDAHTTAAQAIRAHGAAIGWDAETTEAKAADHDKRAAFHQYLGDFMQKNRKATGRKTKKALGEGEDNALSFTAWQDLQRFRAMAKAHIAGHYRQQGGKQVFVHDHERSGKPKMHYVRHLESGHAGFHWAQDPDSAIAAFGEKSRLRGEAEAWEVNPALGDDERQGINEELDSHGFGGDGRWHTVSNALVVIGGSLANYGLEWDETMEAGRFKSDAGHTTINLARSNARDPYSPIPLDNSVLSLSWYRLETGRFEVLAYLS